MVIKRMLMVFTSNDKLGDTGDKTGWYLPEAAHPYAAFKAAGFDITHASIKGGVAPLVSASNYLFYKEVMMYFLSVKGSLSCTIQTTILIVSLPNYYIFTIFCFCFHFYNRIKILLI
mmetsp:Transcript_27224/g.29339  ORF Transcript_27224/g.29339 Transcript_27224/m.29339 type:complete len:117 (+) Transcript_27224:169-519(+)